MAIRTCLTVIPATTCIYKGDFYKPGETYLMGCNTCTCLESGESRCTKMECRMYIYMKTVVSKLADTSPTIGHNASSTNGLQCMHAFPAMHSNFDKDSHINRKEQSNNYQKRLKTVFTRLVFTADWQFPICCL